jgi:hypothetical protein
VKGQPFAPDERMRAFLDQAARIGAGMARAQVGAGSAYADTVHDANGDILDGARTYRLHVDYFGPEAPEGKESNWVQTIPGKSWFQLFRLDPVGGSERTARARSPWTSGAASSRSCAWRRPVCRGASSAGWSRCGSSTAA